MSYLPTTYQLKYYSEFTNERDEKVRLEIHQKGTLTSDFPKQIGELRDLQLNVLGNSADVFAPIIKTELNFSLVDTWDIPSGVQANSIKHGAWEEFYTPDSTGYLVIVKTTAPGGNTFATRWSGYITPDSWQEYIHYHGIVTITARDNIGHLQDFDFDLVGDESGTVTIRQLITAAMQKINLPMDLEFNDSSTGDLEKLETTGTTNGVLDLRVNTSLFKDDDWQTVLSDVLEAIGYVLRYEDSNKIVCFPLRNLQTCGTTSLNPGATEIKFLDGTRTLDPAYKDITEEIEFEPKDKVEVPPAGGVQFSPNYTGSYTAYMLKEDGTSLGNSYGALNEIYSGGPYWDGTQSQRRAFLNIATRELTDDAQRREGDGFKEALFIAANASGDSITPVWKHYMADATGRFTFVFKEKPACLDGNGKLDIASYLKLYKIGVQVNFVTNGQTYNFNFHEMGGYRWDTLGPETIDILMQNDKHEISLEFLSQYGMGHGYLEIKLMWIQYRCTTSTYNGNGCYARLESVELLPWTTNGQIKSDKVHTTNSNNYNVRCTRNPRLGVLSAERTPSLPGFYEKALFCTDSNGTIAPAPYKWKWTNESTYTPFPVQIHKQLLCFYHETTELLEGDCLPSLDSVAARFDKLMLYGGRTHIILGGTLDFTTGRFRTLRMRTFFTWDELWGGGEQAAIAVVPTAADLTQTSGVAVRIDCNTSWRIRTLPSGLTASASSGTGTSYVSIYRDQSFNGGTVVFETADGQHTANLVLTRQTTGVLAMVSVGYDLDDMSFPLIEGLYAIEISFDPDEEGMVFLNFPSWIHFNDADAEGGVIYQPGVYYLWHDEGLTSELPRDGYIEAQGAGTGAEAQLYVKQWN